MGKPAAGTPLNTALAICASLVACFPLNEGAGTTYVDVASGHNGTAGPIVPAWVADGVHCAGGAAALLPMVGAPPNATYRWLFTASSWPDAYCTLFDESGGTIENRNVALFVGTDGRVSYNGAATACMASGSFPAGIFCDLCLTVASSGAATAYLNGNAIGTSGGASASSSTLHLGDNPSGGGGNPNATYHGMMRWSRVLSATEVASLAADPWQMFGAPSQPSLLLRRRRAS